MIVKKEGPIDWRRALSRLSAGAFVLLNILSRHDGIDVSDASLIAISGNGITTHRKYKKELLNMKYLTIEQTGRATYQYTLLGEIDG